MSTRIELRRKLRRIVGPWYEYAGMASRNDGFDDTIVRITKDGKAVVEFSIDCKTRDEAKAEVDNLLRLAGYELEDQ
jgi:hypothetical protein